MQSAPVLKSVIDNKDGTATFEWEPWQADGLYGIWGSAQGFDDRGEHVIGAFLYADQLAVGKAIVPNGERQKHGVIHCQVFACGHTTPTQYPANPSDQLITLPSNIVDVTIGKK